MLIHLFVLLFAGTQIIIAQDVAPTPTLGRWDLEGTFPIANGTRLDCEDYWWIDHNTPPSLANCNTLARIYDIEFNDFIFWNPSLAITGTNEARNGTYETVLTHTVPYTYDFITTCSISLSSSYCVSIPSATTSVSAEAEIKKPSPRRGGEIANCSMWFLPERCNDLEATHGLSLEEFYHMNPSVKEDCSGLEVGFYYCRSTYPNGLEMGIPGWHIDKEGDDEVQSETHDEL